MNTERVTIRWKTFAEEIPKENEALIVCSPKGNISDAEYLTFISQDYLENTRGFYYKKCRCMVWKDCHGEIKVNKKILDWKWCYRKDVVIEQVEQ